MNMRHLGNLLGRLQDYVVQDYVVATEGRLSTRLTAREGKGLCINRKRHAVP
jgi:hypothetical protein